MQCEYGKMAASRFTESVQTHLNPHLNPSGVVVQCLCSYFTMV